MQYKKQIQLFSPSKASSLRFYYATGVKFLAKVSRVNSKLLHDFNMGDFAITAVGYSCICSLLDSFITENDQKSHCVQIKIIKHR